MTDEELLQEAKNARLHAYAPYSHFQVGAALLTKEGRVYHGCNIENAAYGPSNCAERTAFFKAVYAGERDFDRIAIAGAPEGQEPDGMCAPCGVCRQVMMEFCQPDSFRIILSDGKGGVADFTLQELLPCGFGAANLSK
ncbi:MAG: cytidine deaminase [Anaerovibrio sp.]